MLTAIRTSSRSWAYPARRYIHSPLHSSRRPFIPRRPIGIALLSCGIAGGVLYTNNSTIHADSDIDHSGSSGSRTSMSTLLRAYTVYTLCSVPALVDYSPTILATLTAIPGVRQVTEAIVRSTFFAQFVGGDTAEDTIPLLMQLRRDNKGVLLAYSVEVDQDEAERKPEKQAAQYTFESAGHKQHVEETLKCIDVAADFEDQLIGAGSSSGRKTWVAIKLVGGTFIIQVTM